MTLETIRITKDIIQRAADGEVGIVFWGRIEYRDIFPGSDLHFYRWAWELVFKNNEKGGFTTSEPVSSGPECNSTH